MRITSLLLILGSFLPLSNGFMPLTTRPTYSSSTKLHSKRKKSNKKKRKSPSTSKSTAASEDTLVVSKAAQRPSATLAGISEDHRYEQFFYDDATAQQLYHLVDLYERPLLICNPTLGVMAEKKGKEYRLLDRDTRFSFLSGYQEFNLMEPYLIKDYDFDAVFIDPPFANVTPKEIANSLRLMSADKMPLYVGYNCKREEELLEAMNALDGPDIERKWNLRYKEGVSHEMQDAIWFYGPPTV